MIPSFFPIYPSIHPSVHPSIHPSVHPSIHPSIHPLYIYIYTYLLVRPEYCRAALKVFTSIPEMNLPRSGRDTWPVLHDGFYKLAATVTRRSLKPKVTCQPTTDGSGTAAIWAFCHLRQILFKVVFAICCIFLGVGTSLYISISSCPESFRKSHPQKKSVAIEETYIILMTTQGYFTLANCSISCQYCTIQSSTPPLGEFQSATSRPEPSLRQKAGGPGGPEPWETVVGGIFFSVPDQYMSRKSLFYHASW